MTQTTISLDEGQAYDVASALRNDDRHEMADAFSKCARAFGQAVIPGVSVVQRSQIQHAVKQQIERHERNDRPHSAEALRTEVMPDL